MNDVGEAAGNVERAVGGIFSREGSLPAPHACTFLFARVISLWSGSSGRPADACCAARVFDL